MSRWIPPLWLADPLPYGKTRPVVSVASELVKALALSPDDNGRPRRAGHYMLEIGAGLHRLDCASLSDLTRALDVAGTLGARARLEVLPGGRARPVAAAERLYHRSSPLGSITIEAADQGLIQRIELLDVAFERATMTPEGTTQSTAPTVVLGSSRLGSFLRAHRCVRACPSRPPAALAWSSLEQFEHELGGLIAPWPDDPIGRPLLQLGARLAWREQGALTEEWTWPAGDEASDEVLRVVQWPRCSWRSTDLVFVGEFAHRHYLLLDREGALFSYEHELDRMTLAGTGRGWLERVALDEELWSRPAWAPVTVAAQAEARVVEQLGLVADPDASDAFVGCYRGPGIWLRQLRPHGPARPALVLVADDPAAIVESVRCALEHAPGASVRVAESRPGGRERAAALRAAGLLDVAD